MRIQGAASGSGNNPLGHHVWRYLEGSLKAVMEGIGTKHLPEMNVSNVTTQAEARAESRWCKKFSSVPFIIIVLFNVGLLVYGTFLIPEGPNRDFPYQLSIRPYRALPAVCAQDNTLPHGCQAT